MVRGSLEDLSVDWWSVVAGLWISERPVGGSVVGCRWLVVFSNCMTRNLVFLNFAVATFAYVNTITT